MNQKIAILIDGGFYRRRAQALWGDKLPADRLSEMITYCYQHVNDNKDKIKHDLYRIFYYDCPPMQKKIFHPLYKRTIDFSKSEFCKPGYFYAHFNLTIF